MTKLLATLIIPALMSLNPTYARGETITEFLRQFHQNPAKMMERLPSYVENGVAVPRGYIDHEAVTKSLTERLEIRDMIMENEGPPLNGLRLEPNADGKDRPERVVDGGNILRNVRAIDDQRLTRSTLNPLPWTDSYWPTYKGAIGIRYADRGFPNSGNWATNHSYILSKPASSIVAYGDPALINALSPAEKYDFAVGDLDFSLTRYTWNKGALVYEKSGSVPKWVGFCHGWAAAAHMDAPVPAKPVTVTATNGTPITFYPQDVKALQSFLWANASPTTRFMGNRCNVGNPQRDAYGRIVDPLCWDTNPGSWHIAVTNQMGANKRSMVMDSTFDYQVWNFPLADYKFRYFNPQTWQETTNLNSALIPIEKFKLDKFRKYRAPEAKYIVGVYMDVSHVNAINPTRGTLKEVPLKTLRFIYDLELDANLEIVGGEWYSNAHPDFVWTFEKNAQAVSISDSEIAIDAWSANTPVPGEWTALAKRASGRGEPLFAFVKKLAGGVTAPENEGAAPTDPDEVGPIED